MAGERGRISRPEAGWFEAGAGIKNKRMSKIKRGMGRAGGGGGFEKFAILLSGMNSPHPTFGHPLPIG